MDGQLRSVTISADFYWSSSGDDWDGRSGLRSGSGVGVGGGSAGGYDHHHGGGMITVSPFSARSDPPG